MQVTSSLFRRPALFAAFVAASLGAILPLTGQAAEKPAAPDTIEYRVKLSNLVVARATITARRDGQAYTLTSLFRSSGIANVIADMVAETDATGQFGKTGTQPAVYGQQFKRGDKGRRYDIRFSGNKVAETAVQPPRTSFPEGWVAVEPDHLVGVSDPLSAVFRPQPDSPCTGSLAIFDGEMRFDLNLSPKASEKVEMIGFSGVADVCRVQFAPVSGYRKGREDIDWLKGQSKIEVGFVRSDRMQSWVPAIVRVPTRFGPLIIEAVRYGL